LLGDWMARVEVDHVLDWLGNTPWICMEKRRYSSVYSSPRHQTKVSGQIEAPAALSPGKDTPVLTGQEAGWALGPVWTLWWREKISFLCLESSPDS
jgi:hypothetical protein